MTRDAAKRPGVAIEDGTSRRRFTFEETMSKFRTIPYAVLTGSLLVGGSAYAQSMYSIDQRQDYQQNRIEQGIQSGQITRSEAYRLEQGERAIDRAQARARADGVVTQHCRCFSPPTGRTE
jgi:hypothetical protein